MIKYFVLIKKTHCTYSILPPGKKGNRFFFSILKPINGVICWDRRRHGFLVRDHII